MKTFHVWCTLLTGAYQDRITSKLVAQGFTVGPLAADGTISWKNDASTLVAYKVTVEDAKHVKIKDLNASKMCNAIRDVLDEFGAQYHSLIVQEAGATSSWRGGNIKFPVPEKTTRFDRIDEKESTDDPS